MNTERGHQTKPILRPMGPLFRGSSAGEHSGSWVRPDTGRHREPSDHWVLEEHAPHVTGAPWRTRWAAANPVFRWSVYVGVVLVLVALVVLAASFAGAEAADRFGPLVPPSPTPYPDGWTYSAGVLGLLGLRRRGDRHPLGRTCRDAVPLVLLLMPYAMARYALDELRARRGSVSDG